MGVPGRPAKLTPPQFARIHPRPRLFRLLDRARNGRVVWVTGPPGAGKTALVASWIARARSKALWLQVDGGDADPASFFFWLRAAARRVTHARLPVFGPEYLADPVAFGRQFARVLFSATPGTVLVLDDCSEVDADAPLHGILREMFAEIPAGCGAIVTSRSDPSPGLARLRARGTLELVGAGALALTPPEVAAVAKLRGRSLPATTLIARTQGWAAGVALLAAGARGDDVDGSPSTGVFDFLAAEVLDRAPRQVQEVLLRVSLAPRVSASDAARLGGDASAPEVLADLARRGWFTQRHSSGDDTAYQFHPLFREFLAARARRALGEEAYRSLALDTARIVEEGGDLSGAVVLCRAAGAFDEIARIVVTRAPQLIKAGAARTLLGWIDLLPPALVDANPWLLHWRAAARVFFSPSDAIPDAERAFDLFCRTGNGAGAYAAWAGAVHILALGEKEHSNLGPWLDALSRLRDAFPLWPSREIEAAVVSAAVAAYAANRPSDPSIAQWADRAAEIALAPGDPGTRLDAGQKVLLWDGWGGANMKRARVVLDSLRPLLPDGFRSQFDAISWFVGETFFGVSSGDFEGALHSAAHAIELAEQHGLRHWNTTVLAGRLLAELATDQLGRAVKTCGQLAKEARRGSRMAHVEHHGAACVLGIRRGDPRAGVEHGRVAVALATEMATAIPATFARVAHALALERTGTPAMAEAVGIARDAGVPNCEYGALLASATLALARGDERAAARAVEAGFSLGERTGVRWVCWLSPAELADLCALALEHGIATRFATETIRVCRLAPGRRARQLATWPWNVRVQALGGFEVPCDGRPPPEGKAQKKPLELLRLLVAHGERGATLDRLAEALWPDADGDTAHHALETTMYRLRRLLGDAAAVVRRGGRASLDSGRVFVDAWAFDALAVRAESKRASGEAAEALRASAAAVDLYRGDLLPEDDLPGIASERARLRVQLERLAVLRLA